MNMKILLAAGLLTAACSTTPTTPLDAYLNRYAGAESVLTYCPAYGGYSSVAMMTDDAQKNLAQAKALGATDKDIAQARSRVSGVFVVAGALTSPVQACSAMINNLARVRTSVPTV